MTPANYGTRALAYLIDFFFVLVPGSIAILFGIGAVFAESTRGLGAFLIVGGALWLLTAGIYNSIWMQGRTGSTVGKKRMGISLVRTATGEPIGVGFALIRVLAVWFFNSLSFGLYWLADLLAPAFTERRQRVTDRMLSAEVIVGQGTVIPPPPTMPW